MTGSRYASAAVLVGALALSAALILRPSPAAEAGREVPAPAADPPEAASAAVAVLAGGCFWGVQGVFQHVDGVTRAVSGYAGGAKDTAHYEDVETGATGHAEAVEITYDPRKISYGRILQIFFSVVHDPTELDYQGPDSGPQYRSAIFPQSAAQATTAAAYIGQLDKAHVFAEPIVTRLEPDRAFYPAEPYHQDFLTRHPNHPYIVFNDLPKLAELKRLFPERWRAEPALVAAGLRN